MSIVICRFRHIVKHMVKHIVMVVIIDRARVSVRDRLREVRLILRDRVKTYGKYQELDRLQIQRHSQSKSNG